MRYCETTTWDALEDAPLHPYPLPEGWHCEVDERGTWRYFWGDATCGIILTFTYHRDPIGSLAFQWHGQIVQHRDREEIFPPSYTELEELARNGWYFSAPDHPPAR